MRIRILRVVPLFIACLLIFGLCGAVSGYHLNDEAYAAVSADYTDRLIAAYGNVPVYSQNGDVVSTGMQETIPDEKAMSEWYNQLHQIVEDTRPEMKSYYYPDGPIIGYGHDLLGTIVVAIFDESDYVPRETLDEMYSLIDSAAVKRGIENVPVIFTSESIPELSADRDDTWRPLIGGIQCVANGYVGTTAFAATRNGQDGIVITGHLGDVGDVVYQPSPSNAIGTITTISYGANSDSGWVSYSNVADNIFEYSWSQPDVYSYSDPWENLNVIMSGITSGTVNGLVVRESDAYTPYYGFDIPDQWVADYPAASGDSGAPVYYKDGSHRIHVAGSHWGSKNGYAWFSPVSSIMNDLGIIPIF